eukprot:s941_g7.t1
MFLILDEVNKRGVSNRLPPRFTTYGQGGPPCPDAGIEVWINRVKIPVVILASLAFVSRRNLADSTLHAISLLARVFRECQVQEEKEMLAEQYVRSAARIIKSLINDYRSNADKHEVYHLLGSNECLVRADEMWSILKDQFPKLIEDITVEKLLHKATTTTLERLGSMSSKSHPPPNGIIDRLRTGSSFFNEVIKVHWGLKPAPLEQLDSDKIKNIKYLINGAKAQLQYFGYAMRRHNFRHRDNAKNQIIAQDVLKDWLNLRYDLPLERAAAVTHLQALVVATSILHAWAKTFRLTFSTVPLVVDVRNCLRSIENVVDFPDDVWAFGGYQILKADNGAYDDVVQKNKAFSLFSNVLSNMSETQAAQGSSGVKHLQNWNVPLMPGDGREPLATEMIGYWDPDPMDMRPPHAIPQPEVKAMPKKPAAKAMPKGAAPSSAGPASPKAKSRPTPPGVPPEWVIPTLPFGFKEEKSIAEDYGGTGIATRYWIDERGDPNQPAFLLSVIQGPMALAPGISGWAQYLRRVTTYGILAFSQLNTRLVCDDSACTIPTDEWFRMYHYLAKTQMWTKGGSYLTSAALLVMCGDHDIEVANQSSVGQYKKDIRNVLGCEIVPEANRQKSEDSLSGKFRYGTTILITDVQFTIATATGSHNFVMGLQDLGWDNVVVFKIQDVEGRSGMDKFMNTADVVKEYLNANPNLVNVTIHVWLSMSFVMNPNPPHVLLAEANFHIFVRGSIQELEELCSRPVFVAICPDSRFNKVEGRTDEVARRLTSELRDWGILVENDHLTSNSVPYLRGEAQCHGSGGGILEKRGEEGDIGATATRFTKKVRKQLKPKWQDIETANLDLDQRPAASTFWLPINLSKESDILCRRCRMATSFAELEGAEDDPRFCINCSANNRSQYKRTGPELKESQALMILAARLKTALRVTGADQQDPRVGFKDWLINVAASFVANHGLPYGEKLMKAVSHMGGVRVPVEQIKEIFRNGRGKQFSVYRTFILIPELGQATGATPAPQDGILAYRLMKDCGNVLYKDFLKKIIDDDHKMNEIFGPTTATAEKAGDVVEFWLGLLDVAAMTKGTVNVFPDDLDPSPFLNGLEDAVRFFRQTARSTSTINDKRKGSFDCTLDAREMDEVTQITREIKNFKDPTDFHYLTDEELADIIQRYELRMQREQVDIEDEAPEQEPEEEGEDVDMPEAAEGEPKHDEAMRDEVSNARGKLIDALGQIYNVSEDVQVCLYCGSIEHDHEGCEHENKQIIKNAFQLIRTAMYPETTTPKEDEGEANDEEATAEVPPEGDDAPTEKGFNDDEEEEEEEAESPPEHMYERPLFMSQVGDKDEYGSFCIDGYLLAQGGPTTEDGIKNIAKEAMLKGRGDKWTWFEFYDNYPEYNRDVPMYQRLKLPFDCNRDHKFVQILPTTGCYFHSCNYYDGVSFAPKYDPWLDEYEFQLSFDINSVLRHQVGRTSGRRDERGLKCDDCGWVMLEDFLAYESMWRIPRLRRDHIPFRTWDTRNKQWEINYDEGRNRLKILMRIMHSCVVRGHRVRIQLLGLGVHAEVKKSSPYCVRKGITDAVNIPPEGLIIEPIAVRAPSGHSRSGFNEVQLKEELLSHPMTPGFVAAMPECYHETDRDLLMQIWEGGLQPGAGAEQGRICTFFNPFPPWDSRSWKIVKGTAKHKTERAVFYIPTELLMQEFEGRVTASGQPVTTMTIPFGKIKGAWVEDSRGNWHRLLVPSGPCQLIKSVRSPSRYATRDTIIREARLCASAVGEDDAEAAHLRS